jgi:hypothetical protein
MRHRIYEQQCQPALWHQRNQHAGRVLRHKQLDGRIKVAARTIGPGIFDGGSTGFAAKSDH